MAPPHHPFPEREPADFPWAPALRDERRARSAPSITAIIHTRNEARNMAGAIASVAWADHVLVVDMESEDDTVAIARELGAEVLSHPNIGYVEPARNMALAQVTSDWVLVLDADERVAERLGRLLDDLSAGDDCDVVQIAWELWVSGRHVRDSGWGNHWHNRFFRRGHVRWGDRIHCMPEVVGRVVRVPVSDGTCLRHFSYDDLAHVVTKLNRYTDKEADALEAEPVMDWPAMARHLRQEFSWHYTPAEDGTLSAALAMAMLFYRFLARAKRLERAGFPDIGVPADPAAALRDLAHDGRAMHDAGLAAFEAGREPEAVELLRRSAGEQLDVDVLNDLAVMLAQTGRQADARALLQTCLLLDPGHADAGENLATIAAPPEEARAA